MITMQGECSFWALVMKESEIDTLNWFKAENNEDRSGDILVPFDHRWRASFEEDRIRAIFRRRVPASFYPERLYVYITSPDKILLGYCEVQELRKVTLSEAKRYIAQANIDRQELENYFRGYEELGLYLVGSLKRLSPAFSLEELSEETGFTPPQSFVALSQRASAFLAQRMERQK